MQIDDSVPPAWASGQSGLSRQSKVKPWEIRSFTKSSWALQKLGMREAVNLLNG